MLGNRQLVSVFLILVVLLGVFFSMGYLVGRSTPVSASTAEAAAVNASKPMVVENPTHGESGAAKPEPVKPEQVPPSEPAGRPSPTQAAKHEPAPPPAPAEPAGKPSFEEPRPGQTFLQVVATTRPDAELIAETLAKKSFQTSIAPGPSPQVFRVLVGPTKDAADLAETRVRVEAAGFKNPIVRRY